MAGSVAKVGSKAVSRTKRQPNRMVVTEAMVGAACDQLAATLGWAVDRYEQGRATRITEGLPDRRYWHLPRRCRVWVELKRPKGKLTEKQHQWLLSELEAGGLATVIEDVQQLSKLFSILSRPMGFNDAKSLCHDWLHLCAQRGWR